MVVEKVVKGIWRVIDMTIDEAIAKYKEITNTDANCPAHCNISCDKCVQERGQIAEWLEELKNYRDKNKMVVRIDCVNSEEFKDIAIKLAKEQYNKAIDDYKSGIKEELERFEVKNLDTCVLYNLMDRKSEQLKAGGENDNLRR